MASNAGELGEFLERVYAEASEETPDWVGLLDSLARHAGGTYGQLVAGRLSTGALERAEFSGVARKDFNDFLEEHGRSDPRLPQLLGARGRVLSDADVEPPGFDGHPIVRDHLARMDIRRYIGLCLSSDGDEIATLSVQRLRRDGAFDQAAIQRFGVVAPHVLRAQALHAGLSRGQALAGGAAAALRSSSRATVLIDGAARILYLNPAAEDLDRGGRFLRLDRTLLFSDRLAAGVVASTLAAIRITGPAIPDVPAFVIHEPHSDKAQGGALGERRLAARIVAVPPTHPYRLVVAPRAVAALYLLDLDPAWPRVAGSVVEMLSESFGLTPHEARLAAFVGTGGTLEAASRTFGVMRNTVRVQLQAVFEKTGVRRQAELVRLVHGLNVLGT